MTCPSKPGSMKPAVEWISRPRRPSELLPSSRATRSSAELHALERRAEHELAGVQDERLVVRLDELGQVLLRLLDVDERVAVVAEHAEAAVARARRRSTAARAPRRTGRCTMRPSSIAARIVRSDSTMRAIYAGRVRRRRATAARIASIRRCTSDRTAAGAGADAVDRRSRTEIPGPRSRAIWRARSASSRDADSRSASRSFVEQRPRRHCSPTSTATPSSTSPAASAASTSATRTRASTAAVQEQARALPAHRLHDRRRTSSTSRSPSGSGAARRSRARRRPRSSTPAPRRSRTRSRSRARTPGAPAVIAFEGAFHGRTLHGACR